MAFERVHTIWEFYDGPRDGLADFQGRPHYYKNRWDSDADDWSPLFALVPIDGETLQIALEQWSIWLAWNNKFRAGHVPLESHPANPGADARYAELQAMLDARLPKVGESSIFAEAEFRSVESATQVEWRLPPHTFLERTDER